MGRGRDRESERVSPGSVIAINTIGQNSVGFPAFNIPARFTMS